MGGVVAAGSGAPNGWAVALIVLALVCVIAVLVLFVRVLLNRDGALDRTVERLHRLPEWTRPGRTPDQLRRSRQFTATAGVALLVAMVLLLAGLLMDQLGV